MVYFKSFTIRKGLKRACGRLDGSLGAPYLRRKTGALLDIDIGALPKISACLARFPSDLTVYR